MFSRVLGRSNIKLLALGMGCWAIGGPFWRSDGMSREPMGWGQVDDGESTRAVRRAVDLGITLFDTANNYGAGHSERILGHALDGRRHDVLIATKFASVFDEKSATHYDNRSLPMTAEAIQDACEASLQRLNTDYIDLYQLHAGDLDLESAAAARDVLEQLVAQGKIRWYGWSTDDPERARFFAQGTHCTAIQHRLNLLSPLNPALAFQGVLAVCDEYNLASLNRSPLGSGFLTGKFRSDTIINDELDGRHGWNFQEGRMAEYMVLLEQLKEVLTSDGRTVVQGALGWIWARGDRTIPIPGFKSVKQVEENAGALKYGPLAASHMQQIATLLEISA